MNVQPQRKRVQRPSHPAVFAGNHEAELLGECVPKQELGNEEQSGSNEEQPAAGSSLQTNWDRTAGIGGI